MLNIPGIQHNVAYRQTGLAFPQKVPKTLTRTRWLRSEKLQDCVVVEQVSAGMNEFY
jgi:hypothetical protein